MPVGLYNKQQTTMLQTEQVLQERYQLREKLGQNAGRQTWLAEDLEAQPRQLVIVKLLAFNPQNALG